MAIRKGQLAVTLAELNDKADQDLDVVACLKTLDKAVTLWQSTEPFVSRLMVSCVLQADVLSCTLCAWCVISSAGRHALQQGQALPCKRHAFTAILLHNCHPVPQCAWPGSCYALLSYLDSLRCTMLCGY